MAKSIIFAFLTVLFTQTIHLAQAQQTDALVLKYDIFSNGKSIGTADVKLVRSGNTHLYAEYSRIKTSGWWGKIDIKTISIEEFANRTGFIRADSKSLDGKTVYWTGLAANNTSLAGTFTKIRDTNVPERKGIMDLALAISAKQVSETGEIMTLSRTIFAKRIPQMQRAQFAHDAFDTTLNNLPVFLQKFIGKQLPATINIMDSENLVVTRMVIRDLGSKNLSIGGKIIGTRHYKLSDSKFKPMEIWIKSTPSSLPYIVRYVGEDKEGLFEMRLRP